MKTYLKTSINSSALVAMVFGVSLNNSFSADLNIAEKQTVKFMESISQNGQINNTVERSKNIEKDSEYLNSHERENVVAHNSELQTDNVTNALSRQFVKAILGSYKDEIKNAWLSLDLSNDESNVNKEFQVASYDQQNFELVMQARKNNAGKNSDLVASIKNQEKGRWKLRPRVGSSSGAILNYYHSQLNVEFRLTSSEQVMNIHRNLKDFSADVFYNVNLKENSSSLTLSKSLANNFNLQVQKIGRGASAFSGSEDRISLNFGQGF